MRSLRYVLFVAPLLALVAQALVPQGAHSLPLFARKYNMPCTSCHVAFPRLNAFGMQFRQNGYRMIGAKGESPWENSNFPLSLVGNVGASVSSADTTNTSTGSHGRATLSEFRQNAVEFHTAGTLAEKVTFHFDNGFANDTGVLETGMAFLQFDDLFQDGAANFKAGIYDAEIPYLADSRKTTLHEYLSPVTLDGRGVELNGTKPGWMYAAGLINSERTIGKPDSKTRNNLENVYAWLLKDLGGQMVTARVYMDQQDPRAAGKSSSRHVQAELNAYLNHGRWIVIPGYTHESFSDADSTQRDKVDTGLLETLLQLDPAGRWFLTGRYELRHLPKFEVGGAEVFPEEDDMLAVGNLSYMANPNCRIALEYARSQDNVRGPKVDEVDAYVQVGY
jgi:hypothetical protein